MKWQRKQSGGTTGRLCSPAVHLAPALLRAVQCCESPSAPRGGCCLPPPGTKQWYGGAVGAAGVVSAPLHKCTELSSFG